MTEKRFTLNHINEQHISANLYDNGTFIGSIGMGEELITELLNQLNDENEQLKELIKKSVVERLLDNFEYNCKELAKENEQLKSEIEKLSYSNEDLLSEKRNWQRMSDEYCKLSEDNEQLKSTLYYLLNVIQNKCPKYYPKCKEIVRSCFENDSTNSRNDFNNNENDGDVE